LSQTQISKNNLKLIISHLVEETFQESCLNQKSASQASLSLSPKLNQNSFQAKSGPTKEKLKSSYSQQILKKPRLKKNPSENLKNSESLFQKADKKNIKTAGISYYGHEGKTNSIVSIQFSSPKN